MSAVATGYVDGELPVNVQLGENTLITGPSAFKRFHSRLASGLVVGSNSTLDGVQFAAGEEGTISVGSYCYLTHVVLLAELEIVLGDYVVIGWNATIADSDFHPIAPALRIQDARALSPLATGQSRPAVERQRVVVEDDVWIGPNATILKGVTIGRGAFVEPGTVVTRDVRPGSHVRGNPAREVSS